MNYRSREKPAANRVTLVLCALYVLLSFLHKASAQENFAITNYFTERYLDFPMMKISIVPPDGFIKDTNDIGFVNLKYNSAIRAEELREGVTVSAADFLKSFDSIYHKDSLGMKLKESFNFKINGFDAHLVNLSGNIEGDDYIQWVLFIGDASDTYIVKGYIPEKRKKILEQQVRSALLSIFYEPDRRLLPPGADATTTSSAACSCHTKK